MISTLACAIALSAPQLSPTWVEQGAGAVPNTPEHLALGALDGGGAISVRTYRAAVPGSESRLEVIRLSENGDAVYRIDEPEPLEFFQGLLRPAGVTAAAIDPGGGRGPRVGPRGAGAGVASER